MLWKKQVEYLSDIEAIDSMYTLDEDAAVAQLKTQVEFFVEQRDSIDCLARELTQQIRLSEADRKGMASLVHHYDLSTEEGIVLMCVAEALLRIPDVGTEKLLIADKLSSANWQKHLGQGSTSFVNLTTWGLSVSGKILSTPDSTNRFKSIWHKMIKKTSEGVIRQAVRKTIKWMSEEFVLGRHIDEALKRGRQYKKQGYTFSFDMLGEAAMTAEDAERYFLTYADAIEKLAHHIDTKSSIFQRPGISVKLSALYPRYEFTHQETAIPELVSRLKQLALRARDLNIALTVDAEEAERLDMSLQIFKAVYSDSEFAHWEGLGLAIQAYQKRSREICLWLVKLAKQGGKRIQVRLVKGAYWDTEIKQAQMLGWDDYPVFTRKETTDVNYLCCAQILLSSQDVIYSKFATHNAYTVAAILTLIDKKGYSKQVEFQNLQGMGKSLHEQIIKKDMPCRIYAPVGSHKELLPYLVRRLLENGANNSFVNQIGNKNIPIEMLIDNPVERLDKLKSKRHDQINLPRKIFSGRVNSAGYNFTQMSLLRNLQEESEQFRSMQYTAGFDATEGKEPPSGARVVYNPSVSTQKIGDVLFTPLSEVSVIFERVDSKQPEWQAKEVEERALICEKIAEQIESNRSELIYLLQTEAGKTLEDAIDEIREAVDFCRYYAQQARRVCAPTMLAGYTGETDVMTLVGRGVVVCISPWNFPVAIFTGQIVAALVVGNTVIAKPAEQTNLLASRMVELMYAAGVPRLALTLMLGRGEVIGDALVKHPKVAAVMFTGSMQTAQLIQRELALKDGPITPLIAETGGINALIADSTALLEQLTRDVVRSAFGSAGQRCSALRLLILQEDIADAAIEMISGAMALLNVDDPAYLHTDIGPVIDEDSQHMIRDYMVDLQINAKLLFSTDVPKHLNGNYVKPCLFEIPDIGMLKKEVFGPVLHVYRFKRTDLHSVIDQVNNLGYGLTFGVHSRIDSTIKEVISRIEVGNVYVNRNTVGAVVGLQPFGGCRLSGTGPKAGGPHYLPRLCYEKVVSTDTTAAGGNTSLMVMESKELTEV